VLKLKIAAFILFWFGVVFEFVILSGAFVQFRLYGYSEILMPFKSEAYEIFNIPNLIYTGFVHFIHIVAGYWIAKGSNKGVILGIALAIFEIVPFLVIPASQQTLFTPQGIAIRILFAVVIWLIISGRKDLSKLQLSNWRPWKNPLSSKLDDQKV